MGRCAEWDRVAFGGEGTAKGKRLGRKTRRIVGGQSSVGLMEPRLVQVHSISPNVEA